jgi:hypothetical protein
LIELGVDIGSINDGQELARLNVVTNIDEALLQVPISSGVERRLGQGLGGPWKAKFKLGRRFFGSDNLYLLRRQSDGISCLAPLHLIMKPRKQADDEQASSDHKDSQREDDKACHVPLTSCRLRLRARALDCARWRAAVVVICKVHESRLVVFAPVLVRSMTISASVSLIRVNSLLRGFG